MCFFFSFYALLFPLGFFSLPIREIIAMAWRTWDQAFDGYRRAWPGSIRWDRVAFAKDSAMGALVVFGDAGRLAGWYGVWSVAWSRVSYGKTRCIA